MPLDIWLAFAAASTALLVIPGPTVMMVLSYALTQGRRVAVASALGVATGDLIAMTLSVIGLGALFLASALAFTILKWVGAAYLVYLGVKMLRSAARIDAPSALMDKPAGQGAGKVFRDLTTVTALNPKSNTFFIAFVPQFIQADQAFAPQAAILIATFVTIAALNAMIFALAANAMRSRITRPTVQAWLTRAGGATLITMGVLTATLRRAT
ncbi:LysE family translocator [uncultured Tateyamaria sp.]|uniref:LysE family translocator n=1 Tax=uncultured Tateyamaria sp. TaxID=455651 RepID=UPI00262D0C34|nr:LysE family translocator [uncultured Tateyamaria sp.]